jgi:hypothetical protein
MVNKWCMGILLCLLQLGQFAQAENPFSFALIFDSSQIRQPSFHQQVSRSLATFSYEQSFTLWGGELTPQASYSLFRGTNGSDIVGDVQGFSNIDAPRFSQWQEVLLQWQNETTLVRVGQLDANANFMSLDHASLFLNASFGLTPTAFVIPTYPNMRNGIYVQQKIADITKVSVGYYRIDSLANEQNGNKEPLWMMNLCVVCKANYQLTVGYWRVDANTADNISGRFMHIEGELTNQWHGFALYSTNNANHNQVIHQHVKAGMLWLLQPTDNNHVLGAAFSTVQGPINETALEFFYRLPINKHLTLQPDVQWLTDSDHQHANSVIATLRVELAL